MEYWDLYDDKRQPTGEILMRGEAIPTGRYHTIIGVWTVHRKLRRLLITKRAPEKKVCPNQWENTGGSIISGEESRTGAAREVFEETGIPCSPENLRHLCTIKTRCNFVDCYLHYTDFPADAITLQASETVDYRWVTLDELEALIDDGTFADPEIIQYQACRSTLQKAITLSHQESYFLEEGYGPLILAEHI